MQNQLQAFTNDQFGQVRIIEEKGKPFFCGKDIAVSLGYLNPSKALKDHCKSKGVTICSLLTDGGNQKTKFIDEGNLYRLITHSKLPSAEQFETWVFDEVLPTIRKTGTYITAPTDDAKMRLLQTREENIRIRKAQLLYKVSKDCPDSYRGVLQSKITEMLIGKTLLPLPTAQRRTYSAGEIGDILGITSAAVGRLTNAHGLKNDEYGEWVWDKSKYSAHKCRTFRYYIEIVARLKQLSEVV